MSEPKSANITKYSGFCHSCTRKGAIFALLLPSLRYFFHWVGHFWLPWLIAVWMLTPAPRRSLSLGSWWIHQDTDPWSGQQGWGQSWSCPGTPPISRAGRHLLARLLNVLGTSFMESSIHTADAGTSSTGWAFSSRMWSSADFAVFVVAPSAVARPSSRIRFLPVQAPELWMHRAVFAPILLFKLLIISPLRVTISQIS